MAAEWTYRDEGNNNVIFTNVNDHRILRLAKKRNGTRHFCVDHARANIVRSMSHEMEFLEHVVYKILKGVRIRYRGEKLPLTRDFIRELSDHMKGKRPECYKDEKLDESASYGLVLPNFCKLVFYANWIPIRHQHLSHSFLSVSSPIISFEIRPKTCYFPTFDWEPCGKLKDTCFFCLSKLYSQIVKPAVTQTEYCPCDLYSGDETRLKTALLDLIACPQRYFSVKRDDETVFSEKILGKQQTDRRMSLRDRNNLIFEETVACYFSTKGENGVEAFLNLLCNSLQAEVTKPRKPHKRLENVIIPRRFCRRKSSYISTKTSDCLNGRYSTSSILDFLASVHSMRYLPISQVASLNRKVNDHIEIHEEDADILSLGSPYNVDSWKKAAKLHRANEARLAEAALRNSGGTLPQSAVPQNIDGVIEAAETLRRFIIARGFSCCSIIVSLQKIHPHSISELNSTANSNEHHTLQVSDGFGNRYHSSISILDLYKEPPNQIEKYCRREMDMIAFLNNYFATTSTDAVKTSHGTN